MGMLQLSLNDTYFTNLFSLCLIEYIVLLARNGGKTIRIIEAGESGKRSVRISHDNE